MPETVETPVVETPVVETPSEETLLAKAGQDPAPEKVVETPEQKTTREATEAATKTENERLIKADDKTLKPEELAKKQELIKASETAKANSVPEKDGKYEVKLPEALTKQGIELDTKTLETLTPVFKDLGLTQGQVQKLAEAYAPIIKAQVEGQQQAAIAMWNKQGEDWKAESLKQFGATAKEDLALVAKVRDRFGKQITENGKVLTDDKGKPLNDLSVLMEDTKIGNNPVLLRVLRDIGKILGEDTFVESGNPHKAKDDADLYTHPTSQATLK